MASEKMTCENKEGCSCLPGCDCCPKEGIRDCDRGRKHTTGRTKEPSSSKKYQSHGTCPYLWFSHGWGRHGRGRGHHGKHHLKPGHFAADPDHPVDAENSKYKHHSRHHPGHHGFHSSGYGQCPYFYTRGDDSRKEDSGSSGHGGCPYLDAHHGAGGPGCDSDSHHHGNFGFNPWHTYMMMLHHHPFMMGGFPHHGFGHPMPFWHPPPQCPFMMMPHPSIGHCCGSSESENDEADESEGKKDEEEEEEKMAD